MALKTVGAATGFIGRLGALGDTTIYATTGKVGAAGHRLRRLFNRSHGSRMQRATLLALTGAAVGAASKAYTNKRIDQGFTIVDKNSNGTGSLTALGGKRAVATVTRQSGVTVAQDLTDFDTRMAQKSYPTYVVDKS